MSALIGRTNLPQQKGAIMLKTTLLVTGLLFAGNAYADDVIIRRDAPDVVPAPAPTTSTTVEKHGRDCDSKTVHTGERRRRLQDGDADRLRLA